MSPHQEDHSQLQGNLAEWQSITPMRVGRCSHAVVTVGSYLYSFGGQPAGGTHVSSDVEILNTKTGRWTKSGDTMLTARSYFAAAVVEKTKVLICGGDGCKVDAKNDEDAIVTVRSFVELYDTVDGTSTFMPEMNFKRMKCAASAVRNKVYVFGGMDEENRLVDIVEVFCMEKRVWQVLRNRLPMVAPKLMSWRVQAVAIEDQIYILGMPFTGIFNTQTLQFLPKETLPSFWRRNMQTSSSVAIGDKIVLAEYGNAETNFILLDTKTHLMAPLPSLQGRRGPVGELAVVGFDIYSTGGFLDDDRFKHPVDDCEDSSCFSMTLSHWRSSPAVSPREEVCANPDCIQEFFKDGLKYCPCRKVLYCSRDCQIQHRKVHKTDCKIPKIS
eukprot:CAMPEP_0117011684 /NCGR_PEP_ID=MMETSP0472-20121206/10000_1 /TAXON_ID=693140 ORGANISM="Tiarina fusus, Strain LIS" /NCGR_SAMPLE_ID=MMETSP0472 /ASSEMBLY_ACC=CAM_ASM_000603 /LENGTH=384 /DNA_ID=CAMNT_0004714571 /DNA_START=120 /DNA_END=1274 /DNA_ORIENTATION=-